MSIASSLIPALGMLASLLGQYGPARMPDGTDKGEYRAVDPESVQRPVARAQQTTEPITIDGRLEEAAWESAEPLTNFVQSQPRPGYPATEQTVVRILYDQHNLYIGAFLHDSQPGQYVVTTLEKDYESLDNDVFGLALDTFLDHRSSFIFFINPRGAVRDAQGFDDGRDRNLSWDGVIHLRTHTHDRGWTVELAIPWTTLRFDSRFADQEWGVNFMRRVRRKNEDVYWAPLHRRDSVYTMSKAGRLTGLSGIRAGRDLRVTPYVLATRSSHALDATSVYSRAFDAGLDFKYSVTPRMTADLTYRTDFSQVEVDQEQVNLTRFSLFFPEQRDFFVENSGVFAFGDFSEKKFRMGTSLKELSLFHSRRIGLTDDGRPIPIVGGGRLSGRAGGFEIGLISMQTERTESTGSENFSVIRVRRRLFAASDVGAIVTSRQGVTASSDLTYGVDANLSPHRAMLINSYVARSDAPDAQGDGSAARVSVAWRDQLWNVSGMLKRVGEAFDPGVGFVRRRGMRQAYGTVGVHVRPGLRTIQEMNPYVEYDYVTDSRLLPETRTGKLGLVTEFRDGAFIRLSASDRYERLTAPFRVSGGGLVPVGEHRFKESSAGYESSPARALSGGVTLSRGGFYNGTRSSLSLQATWRPSYRLSTDLSMNRNAVRLGGTRFTADVFGVRVNYGHSTRLLASAFLQYNAASGQVVTNCRFNLIHAPLSDVFVVYRERRSEDLEGPPERVVVLKVTRMLAF